ncbi:MAG TPA: hypothetical protein VJC18_03005, partial [bacterium]|nr:hypothetical protein [bacterium]
MRILNDKGNVTAAIIAIMLLAILGAGMAYLVAANQQTRIQQVTSDQSFYSVQAGLEFALGQILEDGWAGTDITCHFSGEVVTIARAGGTITVSATEKDAMSTHSIDDPSPPAPLECLDVNTGSAYISSSVYLMGITINRNAACPLPLTITDMTGTTWSPNLGELIRTIRIDATNRFSAPPTGSGGTFDFGASDVLINNFALHALDYIYWNANVVNHNFQLHFAYTYDGSPYSKVVDVNFLAENQADCLTWDTASARLTWTGSRWRQVTGTTVQNTCASPIRLMIYTPSWSPAVPAVNFTALRINGTNVYSGGSANGIPLAVDYIIPASTTRTVNYLDFSDEILSRNHTVVWTFADATAKTQNLNLFASNQQDCLTINTSGAAINPTTPTRLVGLTIQNTCGQDIGMTSLTMSWAGEPARRLDRSIILDTDGSNTYNSNNASGVPVDFGTNDLYLRNEDSAKAITYFQFNNSITPGLEFTLSFTMGDGNTKSVTFTPNTQAQYLTVNTASASIGGSGSRDLLGITVTN